MDARAAVLIPFIPFLPLFAGCVDADDPVLSLEPNGVPPQQRVPGTYWMVWVHGREAAVREAPSYACDVAFDHEVDPAARTVRYEEQASGDRGRVGVLVAFDLFESWSDCPLEYELRWDPAPMSERLGRYGMLELEVREDGSLLVEGHLVPLGQAAVLRYEGTKPAEDWPRVQMRGEVRVEVLGAWPRTGLHPV